MMVRNALLIAVFAVAACSPATPRKSTDGEAQQKKMDAATTAYAECIATAAETVQVADDAAGSIADRVVLGCKPLRNTLMADVSAFHQIGHPKASIAESRAVAEASIATIEDELRQQTVVSIVKRQTETAGSPAKVK